MVFKETLKPFRKNIVKEFLRDDDYTVAIKKTKKGDRI